MMMLSGVIIHGSNRIVGTSRPPLFTELISFHEESMLSSIQMEKIKQKVDFFFLKLLIFGSKHEKQRAIRGFTDLIKKKCARRSIPTNEKSTAYQNIYTDVLKLCRYFNQF